MDEEMNEIAEVFTVINNVETMKKFINEIFTSRERKTLFLRWQLMKMLKKNIPQRKIASSLGISLCKITRGSKILKNENSVSKNILTMIQ